MSRWLSKMRFSISFGDGNGGLGPPTSVLTDLYPYGIAVADFNSDSRPDLATANRGSSTVSVLLGNGNGTFQGNVDSNAGIAPAIVAGVI